MSGLLVLSRESMAQLMEAGKKVVDSPVHLADFGGYCPAISQLP